MALETVKTDVNSIEANSTKADEKNVLVPPTPNNSQDAQQNGMLIILY